eukprot:TRINITY_DN67254_c0_g1_i1.p1 TRINITY_DN67254_c0_g1~~TRINITY_DN67254_c0_g1_i1.p1  ORF type:complete len:479 (-),score=78.13 TRINITY_DN67254_c0_g1_i1:23-1324(-)
MVNWSLLQNATSPDNKPTPGWLFHELCLDVRSCPNDVADVAEYLMQCVCSDQLNVQLKAVLSIKHLSAEDISFQQYIQACPGALRIMEDIAAPPIVPQARSLEPPEVKTVRDATQSALHAIATPHTIEKQTESANLKQRIQGFGNYQPPADETDQPNGVTGQVGEFVADSIGDMVDDFRDKGAVGALKDATVDALDLVLDGLDSVWGWVVGGKPGDQQRICQPGSGVPVANAGGGSLAYVGTSPYPAPCGSLGRAAPPMGFVQRPPPTNSSSNAYAAAFGGGVIGANNPLQIGGAQSMAGMLAALGGLDSGCVAKVDGTCGAATGGASAPMATSTPNETKSTASGSQMPASAAVALAQPPITDLLSMEDPQASSSTPAAVDSGQAAVSEVDLLGVGDEERTAQGVTFSNNLLGDFGQPPLKTEGACADPLLDF